MRVLTMIIAAGLLAACSPKAPEPAPSASPSVVASETPAPEPVISERPADEASCQAAGGSWTPVCRRQLPQCVTTYNDAQKACRDGDDCSGDCLVHGEFVESGKPAEGLCAVNDDPCGCRQTIEDGVAQSGLCAD
jgi:hypothetical protein